jgi:hypothetical protein
MGMESGTAEQGLLLQELVETVSDLRGPSADSVAVLEASGLQSAITASCWRSTASEELREPLRVDGALLTLISRLRHVSYIPDHGTWFCLKVKALSDEQASVIFDYSTEPSALEPYFSNEQYLLDLKRFPRSEKNKPRWLQNKIREAQPR